MAIGDSLGADWEGSFAPGRIKEIGAYYTDDTAMTIGVAQSLIECGGFNVEHMTEKFIENYEREPWRGYAMGPPTIFRMIKEQGVVKTELDKIFYPGGSFGNGSAMRVSPIGLFYHDSPLKLRKVASKSSKITHSHPLGVEGAVIEAYAVALALKEEPDFIGKLIEFTVENSYKKKLELIRLLIDKKESNSEIVRKLGNGIEAFNSVPLAIYSFLANSSFEDSVVYAVESGGDTDTIAAMCGAIAGAKYGVEAIPDAWLEKLENRSYLEKLACDLWETVTQSKKK